MIFTYPGEPKRMGYLITVMEGMQFVGMAKWQRAQTEGGLKEVVRALKARRAPGRSRHCPAMGHSLASPPSEPD